MNARRAVSATIFLGMLFASAHAQNGPRWYRSNGEFMRLDELAGVGPLPSGWSLVEERTDGASTGEYRATLYRDGVVHGREMLRYDEDGLLSERVRFDREDAAILEETFRYRPDGTLRSMIHCAADEGCLTARFAPPGDRGSESIEGEGLLLQLQHNHSALPTYSRLDRPDGSIEETWYEYGDDGRLRERRTARGAELERLSYRDGRVVLEERLRGGRVVFSAEVRYDSAGRTVERIERTRNRRVRETWEWDSDEEYVRTVWEDDALVIEETVSGDVREITRYRDGKVLLRETFRDGALTQREIFSDGRLIRVEEP
ncbi:MAG: hypothetical protein MI724_02895 [Spirochaetales bacterium]|nr:hypothetical protein [Spirochaetales bacterium]